MPRVYFDTNIFSNLRSGTDSRFDHLTDFLKVYQKKLSFYFSYPHIRDKKKDKTDFKLLDFEFMETIVGDNYLAYDPTEKFTSFYIATPLMVYEDNSSDDFDELINFLEPDTNDDPMIGSLKSFMKTLYSGIPVDVQLGGAGRCS
jgi:hypothetical protein